MRALAGVLREAGITVALEVNVPAETSMQFLDLVDVETVGLCYDVGNATALGFSAATELRVLGSRVVHVHAKDKDGAGVNVPLRYRHGALPRRPRRAARHRVRRSRHDGGDPR